MNLYKKLLALSISILLMFSVLFLTRTNKTTDMEEYSLSHLEGSDFTVVEQAYFNEKIEFDATKYMTSQKDIKRYYWDFGDGNIAEGAKVQHIYNFENRYDVEYPLVYPVTLMAYDGYESISTTHLIKVYPNTYTFFLGCGKLLNDIPSKSSDELGTISIFDEKSETVFYEVEGAVTIPESDWTATLYLEKPFLLKINKIGISFFDNNSNEITTVEKKIGMLSYGRYKTIEIKGSFNHEVEFKSVKLSLYGFSIGKNVKILYGGEKASNICFSFQK